MFCLPKSLIPTTPIVKLASGLILISAQRGSFILFPRNKILGASRSQDRNDQQLQQKSGRGIRSGALPLQQRQQQAGPVFHHSREVLLIAQVNNQRANDNEDVAYDTH